MSGSWRAIAAREPWHTGRRAFGWLPFRLGTKLERSAPLAGSLSPCTGSGARRRCAAPELEDRAEDARRDDRQRIDLQIGIANVAAQAERHADQSAVAAVAEDRADQRQLAEDAVQPVSRHERAG